MQAGHGPRHVGLYFLLTLQTIADVGADGGVAATFKIVAQIPSPTATILYTHVAQHGIEIESGHVESLSHLSGGKSILGWFVKNVESLANNLVGQRQNLLGRWQTQLLATLLFLTLKILPSQHQLGSRLVVKLRGDVEALSFGELVAGFYTSQSVFVIDELKFQPM